jgi:TPR repeat protein
MSILPCALAVGAGSDPDHPRAVDRAPRAAGAGDPDGMYCLGYVGAEGLHPDIAPLEGYDWYRRAAEAGHPAAQVAWGQALLDGQMVAPDPDRGRHWFACAVRAGHTDALLALAFGRMDGAGGRSPEATRTIVTIVAGGRVDDEAYAHLEREIARGLAEHEMAFRLLEVAAEAGNPRAMFYLGRFHHDGIGTPRDPRQAAIWHQRALDTGYTPPSAAKALMDDDADA